jgi:hypothetical protein
MAATAAAQMLLRGFSGRHGGNGASANPAQHPHTAMLSVNLIATDVTLID